METLGNKCPMGHGEMDSGFLHIVMRDRVSGKNVLYAVDGLRCPVCDKTLVTVDAVINRRRVLDGLQD
jgi:hypothetical protein